MEESKFQKLQSVGINIATMKKGDFFTKEQVLDAYYVINPKLAEQIEAYERGEREDPRSFACANVKTAIEKIRLELGLDNIVMNCPNKGLKVMTDAEAVPYLNGQANAGLRKHRAKTQQLFTHIDASALDEKSKRSLESSQRRHAFIAAAAQGARTQSLRFKRKGIEIPDFTSEQKNLLSQDGSEQPE